RLRAKIELRRRLDAIHRDDLAVGGRESEAWRLRRHAPRIAEERHHPQRQDERDPAQWLRRREQHDRDDDRDGDERPAIGMDRREQTAKRAVTVGMSHLPSWRHAMRNRPSASNSASKPGNKGISLTPVTT